MVAAFGYRAIASHADRRRGRPSTPAEKPRRRLRRRVIGRRHAGVEGYVVPLHQIQVGPNKVSGILKWINPKLEEGAKFDKGDKLAEIQDFDYRADFEQAEATLREAERRVAELETTWPLEIEQKEFNITMMSARKELTEFRAKTNSRPARHCRSWNGVSRPCNCRRTGPTSTWRKELELLKRSREEQIKQAKAAEARPGSDDRTKQLLENCTISHPSPARS
jgi:multidrug resistance efflux pump